MKERRAAQSSEKVEASGGERPSTERSQGGWDTPERAAVASLRSFFRSHDRVHSRSAETPLSPCDIDAFLTLGG